MTRRRFQSHWVLAAIVLVAVVVLTKNILAVSQSFLFLQAGFTQQIFGVSDTFMGGVAFAPDGDPWVDQCFQSGGSPLHRFDAQSTIGPVHGTILHPETIVASNGGCGLTNHSNGALYTNTFLGVVKLDANTGAVLAGPAGPAGNGLGIAEDPQTGNLTYVGGDNHSILFIDPTLTTSGTFSNVLPAGNFVDGIAWEPTGTFLFLANRGSSDQLTILDRNGALVQNVPMTSEPDGIAFHSVTPKFVVTNNTDGTMTRFDFPADDYTQTPVLSLFASGGFRGDLSQVGADGCLYLTQNGTRYDDGTVTGQNSLVRICGGFSPPQGLTPQFVVGDVEPHAIGDVVNFWGAQWWKNNFMSGVVTPGVGSFKGFASEAGVCGGVWSTRPGNSPPPPDAIGADIQIIVTDSVVKSGPIITGTIKQIITVHHDGNYGPNPGHRGGGVVTVINCQ